MKVYVLTGCGFNDPRHSVLGVFSNIEELRETKNYLAHVGYGEFDTVETFMDARAETSDRAPPKET